MSDLQTLEGQWTGARSFVITQDVLQGVHLEPRSRFSQLVQGCLLTTDSPGVTELTIEGAVFTPLSPNADSLSFTGTAYVLGLPQASVDVTISIDDGYADLSMIVSLPPGWTFGETFRPMTGPPFDDLVFDEAFFYFTTSPAPAPIAVPWSAEPVVVRQGLTFAANLQPEGILGLISLLFGMDAPVTLSGHVSPAMIGGTILYPEMSVSAELADSKARFPPFTFGTPSLSLDSMLYPGGSPEVLLYLNSSITTGSPILEVQTVLANGSVLSIGLKPAPSTPIRLSDVENLLPVPGFSSLVPVPMQHLLNAIKLAGLNVTILESPFALQAMGLSLAPASPFLFAGGAFKVENVLFNYSLFFDVSSPSASPMSAIFVEGTLSYALKGQSEPAEFEVEAIAAGDDLMLAADLETKISIDDLFETVTSVELPKTVPSIQFDKLGLIFQSTGSPSYTLWGRMDTAAPWPILGVPISPSFSFYYDSKPFNCRLSGSLKIGDEAFSAAVDLTGSPAITASWVPSVSPLTVTALAGYLQLPLPAIPPSLDPALEGATLSYQSGSDELLFALDTNFGAGVYVSMGGKTCAIFEIEQSFDLSNLPLIGSTLAGIASVTIDQLSVVALTPGIDVNAVNAFIGKYAPKYPRLPVGPPPGDVTLYATATLGTDVFNLALPLGGSGSPSVGQSPSSGGAAQAFRATNAPAAAPGGGSSGASTTPDDTIWFTVQKNFGPVTIQKIGVSYSAATDMLWFDIDASLAFGPMTLTLIELGIGSSISSFSPQMALQGIGVSYSNPPLTISGMLMTLAPPPAISFGGEVVVSSETFSLVAFGVYEDVNGTPSLFFFLDIDENFGGPPAFFLTGVAAGFGYNTAVTIPTLAQIPQFPFIQALQGQQGQGQSITGGNVNQVLTTLERILDPSHPPAWVTMSAGSFWGAAGITFTSFQLVHSVALLIVQQTSGQLVLTLLGTANALYPQGSTTANAYAVVQLDLEASLNPSEGVLLIEAVLSRASYLLTPQCVLTGGAAYGMWFGTNPNAGDFVLTIGGYNSQFDPPSYYPTVARVGFDWVIDANTVITGGAYLALTPAVFMAGGQLQATYTAGALQAWFDAYADVIMRWSPFWFDAAIGITIGASYTLNLLFTKLKLTIELGCTLDLWGPPTGGTVTVYWWVISLTFTFGSQSSTPTLPQTWNDIVPMIPGGDATTGNVALTLQATSGLLTSADGVWVVRPANFAFATATPVPATTVTFNEATVSTTLPADPTFDVHPLGWTGVQATHAVTISGDASYSVTPVYASVPAALWGSPPEVDGQPQVPAGNDQVVQGQVVGLQVAVKPPEPGTTLGWADASYFAIDPDLPAGALPWDLPVTIAPPVIGNNQTIDTIQQTVAATGARDAIFAALQTLDYAPGTNGPMDALAVNTAVWFTAQPLLG